MNLEQKQKLLKRYHTSKKAKKITAILLVICVLISSAYAFLTAHQTKGNMFTVGNIRLELHEDGWESNTALTVLEKDGTRYQDGREYINKSKLSNIITGEPITKDPTILNVGKNPAHVYMSVDMPTVKINDAWVDLFDTDYDNSSKWQLFNTKTLDDGRHVYYYYYNEELYPDEETEQLFSTITLKDSVYDKLDLSTEFTVIVNGYGSQITGDPDKDWENIIIPDPYDVEFQVYNLTYLREDSSVFAKEKKFPGDPIEMKFDSSLAKQNFSFDWVTDEGEVAYEGMIMPAEDLTLNANYNAFDSDKQTISNYLKYEIWKDDTSALPYAVLIGADETHPEYPTGSNTETVIVPNFVTFTIENEEIKTLDMKGVYSDPKENDINKDMINFEYIQIDKDTIRNYIQDDIFTLPVKGFAVPKYTDKNNDKHSLLSIMKECYLPDGLKFVVGEFSSVYRTPDKWVTTYSYNPETGKYDKEEKILVLGSTNQTNVSVLEKIHIPYNCEYIGRSVFMMCNHLKEVQIPNTLISIEPYSFSDCSKLNNIELSNSVKKIGDFAFNGCFALSNLSLSNNIVQIGEMAFYDTAMFNDNKYWTGNAFYIGPYCLGYSNTKSPSALTIKDGTILIADYAFDNCRTLNSVIIPESVKYIGIAAFNACNYIDYVNIKGTENAEPLEIAENAFSANIEEFYLPLRKIYLYRHAIWCMYLTYEGTEEQFKSNVIKMDKDAIYSVPRMYYGG